MLHGAEVRERQHRDPRLDAQRGAHDARRGIRDLRELFGRRFDVDCGVAAHDDVMLEDEHVQAADDPGLRVRADDLECRPDRLGVMQVDTRHEGVRVAVGDHAGSEVVAVVDPAPRLVETPAFPLTLFPEKTRVRLALGGCRGIFDRVSSCAWTSRPMTGSKSETGMVSGPPAEAEAGGPRAPPPAPSAAAFPRRTPSRTRSCGPASCGR